MQGFQCLSLQFPALLETTEAQPLAFVVVAVGSGQKAAGSEGCALLIVSPFQEVIFGELFISGVVVDDGNSALVADVVIIVDDVVL